MPVKDLSKPKTGKQLVNALIETGFIGLWKDRGDSIDGVKFSQILRERSSHRERE